jgi:carbamoyl-phosphate synthase large subunit
MEVAASDEEIKAKLKTPNPERLLCIAEAMRRGSSVDEIYELTMVDPWFLRNMKQIIDFEDVIKKTGPEISRELLVEAKGMGYSDMRLAELTGVQEADIRALRKEHGMRAVYKMVDTCAAEFKAYTPYMYSTYEKPVYRVGGEERASPECEAEPSDRKKVIILGSGPNRIGQGIEFDYCCVHAVFALRELGYETIMVNCNPETVSTDYDTSDRLYFEPLTIEDVLNIIEVEKPEGVIVQFGGQTPLKLAVPLEREGVAILGTSPDSIDRAEDRKRFKNLLQKIDLRQPESDTAMSVEEAVAAGGMIGYPVMVRPSYVLGGRAMEIVYDEASLVDYMHRAVKASPEHPVLVDKYLRDAVEVDVDAVSDGKLVVIGGVMQHIEEAGIHSGDSACSLPPYSLDAAIVEEIKRQTRALALELGVVGLMNVQFAVKDSDVYILEVNPRASRTVPFVGKSTGVPLAKIAAKVMVGKTLEDLEFTAEREIRHIAVKEAVFPFDRFQGVDTILGPEMKSTGEVMGIDQDFGLAYAKSQASSNNMIPTSGRMIFSLKDEDKEPSLPLARKIIGLGFSITATRGTAAYLASNGLEVGVINKVKEGRPHIVDLIKNREVNYVVNTVFGAQSQKDSASIRQSAIQYGVPYSTTIAGARAVVEAIAMLKSKKLGIRSIQEYHRV